MTDLPYEFPLRTVPGNVWPPLPGRMTSVWSAYLELCRTERYSPAHIEALSLAQGRALVAHARAQVPYYQEAFGKLNTPLATMDDWRKLPLLSRSTFQEQAERFSAKELPPGTQKVGAVHTAGSSGIAVTVGQTNMVQLWWQAMNLRDLRWSGVDVRGALAAIRYYAGNPKQKELLARGVTLPTWNDQLKELMQTGPSHALDIHQDPRKQLAWLVEKKPDYLISYPSNLAAVAQLALDEKITFPSIRAVLCVSEALPEEIRLLIERAFGAPTKNTYSSMEAGYIASPCPAGGGLHIHAENVLFEILDDDDRPALPGVVGRVVLTTLRNFLTPLIRYEIMDQAAFSPEPCGCGIGLPLILPPWGKRHPPFLLPGGTRKNSMGLAVGMRKIGGTMQFRIRQDAVDRVTVRVLPSGDWSGAHEAQVRALIRDFFEADIACIIEQMTELERTQAGKAGHLDCQAAQALGESDSSLAV